jgi:hypothetical protein
MASIALTYPESWLSISIVVYKLPWATLDNSGVATEVLSTKEYIYTFTDDGTSSYSYVASVAWYDDLPWTIFPDPSGSGWGGWGGASVADIWNAQINDYSSTIGSFWYKFSQYWGVSHVIHDSKWAELSVDEKALIKENKELMVKVLAKLNEEKKLSPDEISKISSWIKPIAIPPQIIDNTSPKIIKLFESLKSWIDLIAKPKEEDNSAEVIAWVIVDVADELKANLGQLYEYIDWYQKIVETLEMDNKNKKQLIKALTE